MTATHHPDGLDPVAEAGGGRKAAPPIDRAVAVLHERGPWLQTAADTMYRYNGSVWRPVAEPTLKALAIEAEGADYWCTSATRRNEILARLAGLVHEPEMKWGQVADHEVAFNNGVLDLNTGRLRDHRAEDYLETVIPWDFDPGLWPGEGEAFDLAEACPTWAAALNTWFPTQGTWKAADNQLALQQFFGYVVLSHAAFKTALLLIGKADAGKGVIIDALTQLVGGEQTAAMPAERMGDPQYHHMIVGKRLNIMSEMPHDAMIRDDGLKMFVSGGDPISVNEKNKPMITYVPATKHVVTANKMPYFNENSQPMMRRLLVVIMRRAVPAGDQIPRPAMTAALQSEMPGLLVWAAKGAADLLATGGTFNQPELGAAALEVARADANPFIDYALDWLTPAPEEFLMYSTIADDLKSVVDKKVSNIQAGKWARAAFDDIERLTGTPMTDGRHWISTKHQRRGIFGWARKG